MRRVALAGLDVHVACISTPVPPPDDRAANDPPMRRGQNHVSGIDDGWSKQDLMDASGLSSKTFDMIRKAARVRGPSHGGLGWVFSTDDLLAIVRTASGGRFTERGAPAAVAWKVLLAERGLAVPE